MPTYLFKASYTKDGIAGVIREGGSGRAKAVQDLVESAGGTVASMYWAFGDDDFLLIADLPDNTAAGALSTTVAATGIASVSTTPLLSPEDIDAIVRKTQSISYRPPGA